MMEDSFKKIKDFEGDIKLFDAKQRRELANLENTLEKITEQISSYKEESKSVEGMVDTLKSNITEFEDQMFRQKEYVSQKLKEFDKYNLEVRDTLDGRIKILERDGFLNTSRLSNNKGLLESLYVKVESLIIKQRDNENNDVELRQSKVEVGDFLRLKEYINNDLYHANRKIEEIMRQLIETDTYLKIYKPAEEFKDITSIFNHVLTKKSDRQRLQEYFKIEKERLRERIDLILDNNPVQKEYAHKRKHELFNDLSEPEVDVDWIVKEKVEKVVHKKKTSNKLNQQISFHSGQVSRAEEYTNK